MCKHLEDLEKHLRQLNIKETFRGQPWTENCHEWVYFNCILETENLKTRFNLPAFVVTHENADERSGTELGLSCSQCNDAIMGLHPRFAVAGATLVS